MSWKRLSHDDWESLLGALERREFTGDAAAHAIVRLAKPFDAHRVKRATQVVKTYLNDPDSWVRHEAIWFLGNWAGLVECAPEVRHALRTDPDPDNRAFAAAALGTLVLLRNDVATRRTLAQVVLDEDEDNGVRLAAYGALLLAVRGAKAKKTADRFLLSQGEIDEIEWSLVADAAGPD